jgi:hypothetical protein
MMERNFLFFFFVYCLEKGFIKQGVVRIFQTLNGFLKYIIHDLKQQELYSSACCIYGWASDYFFFSPSLRSDAVSKFLASSRLPLDFSQDAQSGSIWRAVAN